MHALDAIDRKILSLLQSDSRMTMQELSEKVGLSVSPCHRRVKLLEERGVITRYIATVDQKSLGLHVSVFISIKLARQKEEDLNRFAKAISKWDEVLECYLMTGNRDYLLRVVAADLSSYEAFLKNKLTQARRHRLDRVELCAEPGEVFDRAAGVTQLSPRHCEPPGRREAPPDDRLREAIHLATWKAWIASSQALPCANASRLSQAMTWRVLSSFTTGQTSLFSRRDASEVCIKSARPKKTEGAGKTGCTLHPRSRVQLRTENAHTSIQVQRKHSGLPCAMALRLTSCSPR